jgi:AcrR family transcriptional regulator
MSRTSDQTAADQTATDQSAGDRTTGGRPALRADAERNRSRIVEAARRVFAEQGLDVPMNEVARCAQVGIATLYRRFPTREELITCVFASKMTAYAQAIEQALADPDPWHGFCTYIEQVCAMQAEDHGFTAVLTLTFPTAKAFEAKRHEAYRGFAELIDRAKSVGRLRPDFSPEDLILLLMANAGVVAATAGTAPDAWRRLVAYMTQAFGAEHRELLPRAPTGDSLFQAMLRLSDTRGTTGGGPS